MRLKSVKGLLKSASDSIDNAYSSAKIVSEHFMSVDEKLEGKKDKKVQETDKQVNIITICTVLLLLFVHSIVISFIVFRFWNI